MKSFIVLDRNQQKIYYKFNNNEIQKSFQEFQGSKFCYLNQLAENSKELFEGILEGGEKNLYLDFQINETENIAEQLIQLSSLETQNYSEEFLQSFEAVKTTVQTCLEMQEKNQGLFSFLNQQEMEFENASRRFAEMTQRIKSLSQPMAQGITNPQLESQLKQQFENLQIMARCAQSDSELFHSTIPLNQLKALDLKTQEIKQSISESNRNSYLTLSQALSNVESGKLEILREFFQLLKDEKSSFIQNQFFIYQYREEILSHFYHQASYYFSCFLEIVQHLSNLSYLVFYKQKVFPEYEVNLTKFKSRVQDQIIMGMDFNNFQSLELLYKNIKEFRDFSTYMISNGNTHSKIMGDELSLIEFGQIQIDLESVDQKVEEIYSDLLNLQRVLYTKLQLGELMKEPRLDTQRIVQLRKLLSDVETDLCTMSQESIVTTLMEIQLQKGYQKLEQEIARA